MSLCCSFTTLLSPIWWGKHCCCRSACFCRLSVLWNEIDATSLAILEHCCLLPKPLGRRHQSSVLPGEMILKSISGKKWRWTTSKYILHLMVNRFSSTLSVNQMLCQLLKTLNSAICEKLSKQNSVLFLDTMQIWLPLTFGSQKNQFSTELNYFTLKIKSK